MNGAGRAGESPKRQSGRGGQSPKGGWGGRKEIKSNNFGDGVADMRSRAECAARDAEQGDGDSGEGEGRGLRA